MSTALDAVREVAKAIVGFVAPGAVILTSAVLEGSAGGERITQGEWVTAACATVITAAGVYAIPNKRRKEPEEDTDPLDRVEDGPDHVAGT